MILDTLDQCDRYTYLSTHFAKAFEFLKQLPEDQPIGRHDLDGDNCFAIVESYDTRPLERIKFESHRRYIDIQFIQSGAEKMLWSPIDQLEIKQDYLEEKDLILYSTPAEFTSLNMKSGDFAIYFPEDGHSPKLAHESSSAVRKVVIKVQVE